jgi:hypothetical protein
VPKGCLAVFGAAMAEKARTESASMRFIMGTAS